MIGPVSRLLVLGGQSHGLEEDAGGAVWVAPGAIYTTHQYACHVGLAPRY
jgi:hypothetical protein